MTYLLLGLHRTWQGQVGPINVRRLLAGCIGLLLVGTTGTTLAQSSDWESLRGLPIQRVEILVRGDLSEEVIRTQLWTEEGRLFEPERVDRDQKWIAERFAVTPHAHCEPVDAAGEVVAVEESTGVRVVFVLRDLQAVSKVEFRGNLAVLDAELNDALGLTARGHVPRGLTGPGRLLWLIGRLQERYEEDGYLYTEIDGELVERNGETVLVFDVLEGPKVRVDDVSFVGLEFFSPGDLSSLMETKESFLFFRRTFQRKALDRDLAKIETFLRDEGFLDARVALERLEPTANHGRVDVILRVEQGERYQIGTVRFVGNERFSDDELRNVVKVQGGTPFRRIIFKRDWRRLEEFYGERGYIRLSRAPNAVEESYRLDEPVVDLTFGLDEGLPKRIRDVRIDGNTSTSDSVIRRELFIGPGDLFDSSELSYTEDRLRASRLFLTPDGIPQVFVRHEATDDPNEEDIVIDLVEGETGFMNFTAGVGSGAGFFFGISVDKENFDIADLPSSPWSALPEFLEEKAFHGAGQRFRIRANPGSRFANYLIGLEEPALTGPVERPVSLDFSAYFRESRLRLYDEDRLGVTPILSKALTRDSSIGIGVRADWIEIDDAQEDVPDIFNAQGDFQVRGLLSTFAMRSLDSIRNPTDGFTIRGRAELLGGVAGGDVDAYKGEVVAEFFQPVYENDEGQVSFLQVRGAAAYANEYGDTDDVPFFERYRAGGLSNPLRMRAFDFWGMGPHQSQEPVGGNGGVVINTDFVFPIYETFNSEIHEHIPVLKGVVFLDQGALASDWEDLREEVWRMSVGVGVRLRIPIPILAAPLEMYYGVPLRRDRDDESERFTLSLSTRF